MANVVRIANSDRVVTIITDTQTAAAGAMTGSLAAGGAGVMTYLTGFYLTGGGATGASVIEMTITGAGSGTMKFRFVVPAGATADFPYKWIAFDPPIPATAVNSAITLSVPSFGSGNTNAALVSTGYQQPI